VFYRIKYLFTIEQKFSLFDPIKIFLGIMTENFFGAIVKVFLAVIIEILLVRVSNLILMLN
jgi:hypothetical protein